MTDFVASLSHSAYRYVVPVQETETTGYEIRKRRKQSCQFRVGKSSSRWYLSATLAFNYWTRSSSALYMPGPRTQNDELLKARPTSPNQQITSTETHQPLCPLAAERGPARPKKKALKIRETIRGKNEKRKVFFNFYQNRQFRYGTSEVVNVNVRSEVAGCNNCDTPLDTQSKLTRMSPLPLCLHLL